MKLADKIQILRKKYNYSQEELAEKCNVSRQAISKWEANKAFPEIDKLVLLSSLFSVSVDTLIKEDLNIDDVLLNKSCHKKIKTHTAGYYEGLLIKESLCDEEILDLLNINKVELWETEGIPKYWTALYFTSSDIDLPKKFSKVLKNDEISNGNWYVDFKHRNTKYIVFKDKILSYTIGNQEEKNKVAIECRKQGIDSIDEIGE